MLTSGTKLGTYEVTSHIGSGGMGEVYQAHDSKLGRDVAIKVLPERFARDPERLARFQREAKMLAALNHPNIAAIYGLEQSGSTHYLVMELVPGQTLAERIRSGAIPIDEALPIARQVADAVEYAHDKSVIHRDLKPANIKVTPDGTVKVLDFGLAKAMSEDVGETDMSNSPTLSMAATRQGVILGTAAYMSPEQARGKAVDRRADIWAFGGVLFEMLTGRQAFEAEDISLTLAAVMKSEPDWESLPKGLSPALRTVLRRCLQKDPKQRLQAMGDVRLAMQGAFESEATADAARQIASPPPRWWSQPRWLATGVLLGILAGVGIGWTLWVRGRVASNIPVRRFSVSVPASVDFPVAGGTFIALSPDGQTIVYRGFSGGVSHLYKRRLDQLDAAMIPGTEGADEGAFFSPDSRSLAFGLDGKLMRVDLAGGSPARIADLTIAARGGSWGLDDTIIIGLRERGLARVPATGGKVESLTTPDDGRNSWYPQILPGGKAVLFTSSDNVPDSGDVMLLDLATGKQRIVVPGGVAGHYTPTGHLVFLRGGDLWAVGFDLKTLTVEGRPALVEQGIRVEPGGAIQFAVAEDGGLAYLSGGGNAASLKLVWVYRDGREEPIAAAAANYNEFTLSPDGTRVAVRIFGNNSTAVWIYDLARGTNTRLTFDSDKVGAGFPTWTPDGARVAFGPPLSWKRADGIGIVEHLDEAAGRFPQAFTPDGKKLLFEDATNANGGVGFGVLTLEGKRAATLVIHADFGQQNAALSPDGRWLAYSSDETGQRQVFVRPFPDVNGGRWQISTDGGDWPVWNPAGNELFYRSRTGMMALTFKTAPTFTQGALTRLFARNIVGGNNRRMAVSPDGKRFLLLANAAENGNSEAVRSQLVVVQNWFEELKRRVPTGTK